MCCYSVLLTMSRTDLELKMFKNYLTLKCLLLVVVFAVVTGDSSPRAFSQKKQQIRKVQLSEIQNGNQVIIGELGFAIGTIVKVEGVWHEPPVSKAITKSSPERRFEITVVNGTRLKPTVSFMESHVSMLWGPKKEMKNSNVFHAYESCRYEGLPVGAPDYIQSRGGAFTLYSNLVLFVK